MKDLKIGTLVYDRVREKWGFVASRSFFLERIPSKVVVLEALYPHTSTSETARKLVSKRYRRRGVDEFWVTYRNEVSTVRTPKTEYLVLDKRQKGAIRIGDKWVVAKQPKR